jgi:hypothetical protein
VRGLNPAEPDYALQKALGTGAQALAATRSITIGTAGGGTGAGGTGGGVDWVQRSGSYPWIADYHSATVNLAGPTAWLPVSSLFILDPTHPGYGLFPTLT